MENLANGENYKIAKRKAKEFYGKIDRAWCPALDDYIVFNKTGFQHLMRKGNVPRVNSEQKRRFALLPYACLLLNDSNVRIIFRKEKDATFWSFTEEINDRAIVLIVRQINDGNKHFFSIFERRF
jgi:hypothetical protein